MDATCLALNYIGILDRNNATQMHLFLKMTYFVIPNSIPQDANNHAFSTQLLTKIPPNGENCKRNCLYWSTEKHSLLYTLLGSTKVCKDFCLSIIQNICTPAVVTLH
jgi:hypothetical protein